MTTPKVYEAITKITEALSKIGIAKERPGQNYKFRGIDDVYNHLSALLAEYKLCIIPVLLERECVERVAKSGGALFYATVKARFDIVSAEDGSKHEAITYGEAMDSSDKATNKAMSTAYKYMAFMTFCIPTEGDNDTENQTHEVIAVDPLKERVEGFKNTLGKCTNKNQMAAVVANNSKLLLWIKEQSQPHYEDLMAEVAKTNEAFDLAEAAE